MRQPLQETFARQVADARLRLDGLFQRAAENPQAQPLVSEALEELCTALEELRVTSEELSAQNDEIAVTRGLADTQRQNYQELFEFAPDPYLVTDTTGVIQQANRKAAALFGVRQDFIRGKPIALFFPPERRPEYRRMLLDLTRNNAANEMEMEMEIRPRDATAIPVAVKLAVVRQSLPGGWRPIGIRWIVHDISARKRSEAQIKSQLQRLTILGAINEAITSSLDLDTVIEVLFDKLQEFFPYAIVTTVRLFHPDTRELQPLFCRNIDAIGWKAAGLQEAGPRATECIESRKPLVIADLSSDPRTVRGEFYRKNGLESAMTVPLLLQDDVLGILSVYSKTRREFAAEEIELLASVGQQAAIAIQNSRFYDKVKRQSTEVQHAHDRLEEKVEERTVELAKINEILRAEIDARRKIEELLRQSERKLRALTQEQEQQLIASDRLVSVGELAASIAHEFNNPLQIIMGFAQELLDEEKAGPRYDGLKIIEAETVRCRELIRNLMNFARPQSAKPEATEVEPVIANATRLALHYLMKSKVRLQTEIAPYLPAIRADANQLQQVLINLLFNAAEAMPEGGEVKVGAALSGDHTVVISIADTGVGISASALPHIFRPFFTTKQKKGMGLGLSICERIVRSHGGRIAVESAPDKGTTFHLHFPIAEENYERAS